MRCKRRNRNTFRPSATSPVSSASTMARQKQAEGDVLIRHFTWRRSTILVCAVLYTFLCRSFYLPLCVAPYRYGQAKINSIRWWFRFDLPQKKYMFILFAIAFSVCGYVYHCRCLPIYWSGVLVSCVPAKEYIPFVESVFFYHYRFVFP